MRATWRRVEDYWLDPIALPLRDRIMRSSWAPDEFIEFCDLCGGDVGAHEASELGCAECRGRRLPWDRFVRLGSYEAPIGDWIREVKFLREARLGRDLGILLGQQVRIVLDAIGLEMPVVVVPVPMTRRRRCARGIDHALEIARGVARVLDAPVNRALARSHSPSQRSVAPSQRQANVSGRFRLSRPERVARRAVVLVDDVATSGATLRACARALKGYEGARRSAKGPGPGLLIAATLAVTPRDPRNHAVAVSTAPAS